jgi:MFS family permease
MPRAVTSIDENLAMLGALMISAAAVGNILGKIVLGTLSDLMGIRNSMVLFAIVSSIGFALMLFMMGGNTPIMLIAGFCIGTGDAMMSVGLPLMTRAAYGDRQYAKIYSYLNMPIAILGGLGATYVAFVGENLGGFPIAYGLGIAFMVVVAACCIIAFNSSRKYLPMWTYEGDPEKNRQGEIISK